MPPPGQFIAERGAEEKNWQKAWLLRLRLGYGLKKLRQGRMFGPMKYAFDPAKDAINRAKHGVSLALAEILFAGPHATTSDDRFDYGEVRQIAFGLIAGRLFVCVYVGPAGGAAGDLAS